MIATAAPGWFLEHAYLIPLIPAIAFALIIAFGKRIPDTRIGRYTIPGGGSLIGVASMLGSLFFAAGAALQWIQYTDGENYVAAVRKSWVWWQSGGIEIGLGQQIDGLSVMVLLLVAFISTLVQIYSLEYLKGDRRYTHFFASLTLFSAGMLVMVLAENMVQLILGWEIMGLCSFMLIGHWWEDKANSRASLKAFFTVRTGDIGLLVGTAIVGLSAQKWINANGLQDQYSGFSIEGICRWALAGDSQYKSVLTWGAVALFIACIGKSGQFPLHTWLPDAMAGPTPVSSLLHSSTMVVAGVFLVARLYPVFFEGLRILDTNVNLIAVIGGITIIVAALLAFVQTDIKKVLAYSTVSQLGYMMMGLGVGAWTPAVFHIWTHAFFKCCLFLCAGSIAHSGSHHSFDMKKDMGGLWRKMPVTFATWTISSMALAGVPFFAGWYSKDEIIDIAGGNQYWVFFAIGLAGAFLTTAYMTRATYLTFFGKARGAAAGIHEEDHSDAHAPAPAAHGAADAHDVHDAHDAHDAHDSHAGPHESPWLIKGPLVILATLAIVAGLINAPAFKIFKFEEWVEPKAMPVSLTGETIHEGSARGITVGAFGLRTSSEGESESEPVPAEGDGHSPTEGESGAEEHSEGEEHSAGYPGSAIEEGHLTGDCGTPGFVPAAGTTCYAPGVIHHEFKWVKALPAFLLVVLGFIISSAVCVTLYGKKRRPLAGLTERNIIARGLYKFLWNRYYLDALYEGVIVRGIAHPLARAMYWLNQNVFDGIVNGAGRSGRKVGEITYKYVDQGLVDSAVNGSGAAARGTGTALRPTQSGKVSQYGALLFAAAALAALILVLVNS